MATLLFALHTSWWGCPHGRWTASGWPWSSSAWRGSGCKWPWFGLSGPWTACTSSARRRPGRPLSRRPVRLSLRRLRSLHSGWVDRLRSEPFWKRTNPTRGEIQAGVSGSEGGTHHHKHASSKTTALALDWREDGVWRRKKERNGWPHCEPPDPDPFHLFIPIKNTLTQNMFHFHWGCCIHTRGDGFKWRKTKPWLSPKSCQHRVQTPVEAFTFSRKR